MWQGIKFNMTPYVQLYVLWLSQWFWSSWRPILEDFESSNQEETEDWQSGWWWKCQMSVVISSLVWYCPTDRNQLQQREMSVISSSTPNPGFNKWHVGGDAVYYFWKGWRKRKSRHNITEISRPLLNGWATCHLETIWELTNLSVLWHPSSLPISPSYQSNLRSLHQRPFSF